jgi:DnaK suppressor protein
MTKKKKSTQIVFPKSILKPVGDFLQSQLKELRKRKKNISSEDPFNTVARDTNTASPDADAEEQFGHERSSAINEQLDRKIIQTKKALSRIKIGKYGVCSNCGNMIDTDRLMVFPEATLCVKCEKNQEKN